MASPEQPRSKPYRRLNGEGSFYFTPADGRWRVAFHDLDGRKRVLSARSKVEAMVKLRNALADRDRGVLAPPRGTVPTLGQWLDYWLESQQISVRPSTMTAYTHVLSLIPDRLRSLKIDQVRPEHFERLYRDLMLERGLSNSTVRMTHGAAKRALTLAVRYGHLTINPLTLMKAPPIRHKEITPLTLAQTQALLAGCLDATDQARWQIALLLGLRQGEVLGLRWSDIDFDNDTLAVRQALQYQRKRGLVIVDVKSRAGLRTIFLPPQLRDSLKEHRTAQHTRRLAAGPAWVDNGLVFTASHGKPVQPREDSRRWKELLEAAGLPHFRVHDGRHTAATLMFAQGASARTVMEVLGHSQISHTLNIYTHISAEVLANVARAMGNAVYPQQEPPRPPTDLSAVRGARGDSPQL